MNDPNTNGIAYNNHNNNIHYNYHPHEPITTTTTTTTTTQHSNNNNNPNYIHLYTPPLLLLLLLLYTLYTLLPHRPTSSSSPPKQTTTHHHPTMPIQTIQDLQTLTPYIPLRLSPPERSLLTILESALLVSEYTDEVDVASNRYGGVGFRGGYGGGGGIGQQGKIRRILDGILEACYVSTGLGVCGGMDGPRVVVEAMEGGGVGGVGGGKRVGKGGRLGGLGGGGGGKKSGGFLGKKRAKQAEKARKKELKMLKKGRGKGKGKKKKKRGNSKRRMDDSDYDEEEYEDGGVTEDTTTLSATSSAVEGITIDSSGSPVPEDEDDDEEEDDDDMDENHNVEDEEEESNPNPAADTENDDATMTTPPSSPSPHTTTTTTHQKKRKNTTTPLPSPTHTQQHPILPPHYTTITSIASLPPAQNEQFFQTIFEIGRRNKVLNPSKMRDTYGKLMHLLQDAQSPSVARSLGFSLYKDMVMVGPVLEERGWEGVLEDERLVKATGCVSVMEVIGEAGEAGKPRSREDIDRDVAEKNRSLEELLVEYAGEEDEDGAEDGGNTNNNNTARRELLRRCIESISDAIAVMESNVMPVRRILALLELNFSPHACQKGFSLELRGGGNCFVKDHHRSSLDSSSTSSSTYGGGGSGGGYGFGAFGNTFGLGGGGGGRDRNGPTLSHNHSTQYTFVWQSLRLWQEVMMNMHRLWVCADDDLLSTSTSYQLLNTGQGLNRVQSCPRVGKVMRSLLHKTQKSSTTPWVGLSVIHLGDRDVPNALVFIDKYTQIPRFLRPIVDVCDGMPALCASDERIAGYVEAEFGNVRELRMSVLSDYFKHGFDGSGDDGGSCIDGRLTSSWNWTSRIVKKNYYHFFMLSGFQGFDGDFK